MSQIKLQSVLVSFSFIIYILCSKCFLLQLCLWKKTSLLFLRLVKIDLDIRPLFWVGTNVKGSKVSVTLFARNCRCYFCVCWRNSMFLINTFGGKVLRLHLSRAVTLGKFSMHPTWTCSENLHGRNKCDAWMLDISSNASKIKFHSSSSC